MSCSFYTQGFAKAFSAGINEYLEHGADVIVNSDGDNQTPAEISQAFPTDFGGGAETVITNHDSAASLRFPFQRSRGGLTAPVSTDAHNSFLAFFFELGIFGLFAYLAIIASIVQMGLKLYRNGYSCWDRWLGVVVVTIMVGYLVLALVGTRHHFIVISQIYLYAFVGGITGLYSRRWSSPELHAFPNQYRYSKTGQDQTLCSNIPATIHERR